MSDRECSEKQKTINESDFNTALQIFNLKIISETLADVYKNISSILEENIVTTSQQLEGLCMFFDLVGTECIFD